MSEDAVDLHLRRVLAIEDDTSAESVAAAEAKGVEAHEVSPPQGKLLGLLVRISGARRVLEVGTQAGVSTLWMARALPEGGSLTTIEIDPHPAEVAAATFERSGVADRVDLRIGDALEVIAELEGPFDLVFLDADKDRNPQYLEAVLPLMRPGSVLVADNVVRGGAVLDASGKDPRVVGVRAFLEAVGRDPRLDATALQTVGTKGWDGFLLAVVTEASS